MLIELINKAPIPYCGSNDNSLTGVSLCEILFSFMLEKYIVGDACGLRPPSFESSGVLYIAPTYTCSSSIQELIRQGMRQKLEKYFFRCKKNTWHIASNYVLQLPKYLSIVVDRCRYIKNNFTKDIFPIPVDMTVAHGLHKFSLQATIDHHGPSMYSGQYTVYPKKYAHGFCFAVLYCGYTLTDFPISIRLTSLALLQSNDCPSASKATLMNMDKYFMWIHYDRLHDQNKAKHNKTVCIFLGIYSTASINRFEKSSITTTPKLWSLKWLIPKTPLMLIW